jgi:hypothetical protein
MQIRKIIKADFGVDLPIYKWLKRKGYKKIAFAIPILIIGTMFYLIYPNDSFYIQDFQSNTNISFPASGVIVKKDATYPDIHGTYTSKAIIRLSTQDYKTLYQKLTADPVFRADTSSFHFLGDTEEFFEAKDIKMSQISTILIGVREAQFKIGFVNDGKTIVFERHSS